MVEEDACSAAPSPAPSGWEAMLADPPWAAKSFLAVSVATIGGSGVLDRKLYVSRLSLNSVEAILAVSYRLGFSPVS